MVSESLLSSSMLEANQAGVEQFFVGVAGVPKIDQATINEAFRVQYTLPYIIAFLATGIVTILLSAVVPLLYILRLNPKNHAVRSEEHGNFRDQRDDVLLPRW